ncbi:MAG: DUF4349 domain-containing protein [Eubacteriales bacterium]|mgnify:CR=1 FL=1|nr:DUF4349 domain-containing protein [Eubacteriales bacterium]
MRHDPFESLLEQHLLGVVETEGREELEAHLKECPACRLRLKVLEDCRRINEEDEVPATFSSSWRRKIQEQEDFPMKKKTPGWTKWLAAAAAVALVLVGTLLTGNELDRALGRRTPEGDQAPGGGIGYYSSANSRAGAGEDMAAFQPAPQASEPMMWAADTATGKEAQELKIIRRISMTSATRAFDSDYQAIRNALETAGGRIENADTRTAANGLRTAYLTLRVPADQLDTFTGMLKALGNLEAFSESAEDVSEQYSDTDSRLRTQKAKMERLMALLEKAVSVEDLISLESAIADTQYLIDSYTGQLQGIDSRVDDATLTMTLKEMSALDTAEASRETLWDRIVGGVSHMWKLLREWAADAAVFLVAILPIIILTVIVILIVRAIIKRRIKK